MNWKLPADKDVAVKAWMKAKGWKVEESEDVPQQQVYLWIHAPARGGPIVLGMSREVLTDTPLFAIQELLDRLEVAAELKALPRRARVLVRRKDSFVLEDFVRG